MRSTNEHPDKFNSPSFWPSLWGLSPLAFVTSASALPQILLNSQPECTHNTSHTRCSHHIHNHYSDHSHKACISFIKIVQRHATPASCWSGIESDNPSKKLNLSYQKLWVHTRVYNSTDLLPHPASTTTSASGLPRLKTQTHFKPGCTRIKKIRWTHSMTHGF